MAVLQIIGKEYFRYEASFINHSEYWRVLSAHFVHLNWLHWALNSAGLLLLVAITQVQWRVQKWILILLVHGLVISLAFLLFNPELKWYVGLSGLLYGLYANAALELWKKDKLIAGLLLLFVIAKIVSEQWFGNVLEVTNILNAPVVVDAHAYGLVCGLIFALLQILLSNKTQY